jgi:hypothetical protein
MEPVAAMPAYPITRESSLPDVDDIRRTLEASAFAPMPPATDRTAWSAVGRRPWIEEGLPALLERAEELAEQTIGVVRATDYLSFYRTGLRDAHNSAAGRHTSAVGLLTAAACLTGDERYLDPLLDASWATAEETSWIMPPHLGNESGGELPDVADPRIDLRVAGVGKILAEMLYLLGDHMDAVNPMWRKRISFEIERQVIGPYLRRQSWWETTDSNWNAVCTCGVVACALMGGFGLDTQAAVLHKAVASVPRFLEGFAEDGGCTEGPGYWAYGVNNFAGLAYYVHCVTGGEVDLLADPLVKRVMEYPPGVVLSGSRVVAFADCSPTVGFRSGPVAWVADRLAVPQMVALASTASGRRPYPTTMLDIWLLPEPRTFEAPPRTWLPDLMLLVERTDAPAGENLVLAAKGGHNNEIHNHNDVGAFIVHWRGESLVCDLGAGNYIRQLFSSGRYELLSTRSLGHNVPVINGCEQGTGADFRAGGFERRDADGSVGVSMDIAGAYPPEARLDSLRRSVVLSREGEGAVELVDEVRFAEPGGRYELPLYTEGKFGAGGDGNVQVTGRNGRLHVELDGDPLSVQIENFEHGDPRWERHFGPELSRCWLRLTAEDTKATVRLRLVPVE